MHLARPRSGVAWGKWKFRCGADARAVCAYGGGAAAQPCTAVCSACGGYGGGAEPPWGLYMPGCRCIVLITRARVGLANPIASQQPRPGAGFDAALKIRPSRDVGAELEESEEFNGCPYVYVSHRHIHAESGATAQIRHHRTEYSDGTIAAQRCECAPCCVTV